MDEDHTRTRGSPTSVRVHPRKGAVIAQLIADRWGHGPPVVMVHGNVMDGAMTFRAQRPLAERWTLVVCDRPGYGANADVEREDFEADAPLVAEQLGDGAHLVGHSYGGVACLLAAAHRPEAVWSLTVSEPPAFALARGDPAVDALVTRLAELAENGPEDPERFLGMFLTAVGSSVTLPSPLPPPLARGARVLQGGRGPWEADIPVAQLAAAPFPKLVVSGGHHAAFDAVCDALAAGLGSERAVIPGAGHSVPQTGGPYNARLVAFLEAASGGR